MFVDIDTADYSTTIGCYNIVQIENHVVKGGLYLGTTILLSNGTKIVLKEVNRYTKKKIKEVCSKYSK